LNGKDRSDGESANGAEVPELADAALNIEPSSNDLVPLPLMLVLGDDKSKE